MGAAYLSGLRAALQRWPVALLLFLVSLAAGLTAAAAAWLWLAAALRDSLPTRTLLVDLDINVFVDLFVHHHESFTMLLVVGGALIAVFMLLGVWLNAVAVVAVGDDTGLHECLRRGVDLYPAYFRLWVLASVLNVASVIAVYALGRTLTRWTAESGSEMTFYWVLAASLVVVTGLLFSLATIHDHARIHCAATESGAARSYAWAFGYVCRGEWRALPLALMLGGSGLIVWAVYQTVGMLIVPHSGVGVALSLIWGQVLLFARMLIRVWFFAAETALQNMSDTPAA